MSSSLSHDPVGNHTFLDLSRDCLPRVGIVDTVRTPFVKAPGVFKDLSAVDLAAHTISRLAERVGVLPEEVVFGSAITGPRVANLARQAVLKADLRNNVGGIDLGERVPPTTGSLNQSNYCITALVSIEVLASMIALGQISVGIAGGSESMSNPSIALSPKGTRFQVDRSRLKGAKRPGLYQGLGKEYYFPEEPKLKEPATGLTMQEHAQQTAHRYNISRQAQDEFAHGSHQKAARAQREGVFDQHIAALSGVKRDNFVNGKTTLEQYAAQVAKVGKIENPTLTAWNSTGFTDGAAAVCLMSERHATAIGKPVLAYIQAIQQASIDPQADGLLQAPAIAVPLLLKKMGLTINDIALWEVHEAFAAQTLDNLRSWEEGWPKYGIEPIGRVPMERLNIHGGSLALGHPLAATGARLCAIATELHRLANEQHRPQMAILSACAAGGKAAAVLLRSEPS